jgi:hypothetical protein
MSETEIFIDRTKYRHIRDAANAAGISSSYLSKFCREGEVRATRVDGVWFVNETSLRELMEARDARKRDWHERLTAERIAERTTASASVVPTPVSMPAAAAVADRDFTPIPRTRVAPRTLHRVVAERRMQEKASARRTVMTASIASLLFISSLGLAFSGGTPTLASRDTSLASIADVGAAVIKKFTSFFDSIFAVNDYTIPPAWEKTIVEDPNTERGAGGGTVNNTTNNNYVTNNNYIQTGSASGGVSERIVDGKLAAMENYFDGRLDLLSYEGQRQTQDLADDLLGNGMGGAGFDDIDITDSNFTGGSISGSSLSNITFLGDTAFSSLSVTDATSTSATSTNMYVSGSFGFGTSTGLLRTTNGVASTLANGGNGQVLKMVGGNLAWSTDLTGGGGGGASFFASTTDDLAIYPADPTDVLIIGESATTSVGYILEVAGDALLRGGVTTYGPLTASRFVATSSTSSIFPYASTTAISTNSLCINGDCRQAWPTDSAFSTTSAEYFVHSSTTIPKTYTANIYTATQTFTNASTTNISASYASSTSGFFGNLSIGSLSGVLKAAAGVVSAGLVDLASEVTGILGVTRGGTGWNTVQAGSLLYGSGSSSLATTSAGTGGQVLALVGNVPTWVATTTFSSGLTYSNGNVTLDASGNWSGTFDGLEGSAYLANGFSTTSADYWKLNRDFFSTTSASYFASVGLAFSTTSADAWKDQRNFFSTTSADYWGSTKGYATFGYPFPAGATSTLIAFNGGLTAYASSTIGSGSQAGGLTISGGATTTGYLKVLSTATSSFAGGLQTTALNVTSTTASSTFANGLNLSGGCYAIGGTCLTTGSLGLTGTTGQLAYFSGTNTAVGTSTIFIESGGNVGIGTTTPVAKFEVLSSSADIAKFSSSIGNSGGVQGVAGIGLDYFSGSQNPAVLIQAEENTVSTYLSNLTFSLRASAADVAPTERMRIMNSGNVGIGTTSPFAKLHVASTASGATAASSNADEFVIEGAGVTGMTILAGTASDASLFFGDSGSASIGRIVYDNNVNDLSLWTNATERMTIDASGSVGIGTSTPWANLSVHSTAGTPQFVIGSSTATQFIVDASGNVGVGIASPAAKLHVSDATNITPDANGAGQFNITGSGYSGFTALDGTAMYIGHNSASRRLDLMTNETSRLSISAAGLVGIGTTTPQWLLNPTSATASQLSLSAGAGIAQWAFRNAGGNLYFATTTVAGTATTSVSALSIIGASGNVGIGDTTPAALLTVGTSDAFQVDASGDVSTSGTITEGGSAVLSAANIDTCAEFILLVAAFDTGTCGNLVFSASPTFTGTITGASADLTGSLDVTGAITEGGSAVLSAANIDTCAEFILLVAAFDTGTCGNLVFSASPTISGTLDAAIIEVSGDVIVGPSTDTVPPSANTIGARVDNAGYIAANRSAGPSAYFGRTNDGNIVEFYDAGVLAGSISINAINGDILYNAFTGAHYSTTEESIEYGMLVELDGTQTSRREKPDSEPTYGVRKTTHANSSAVFGSMSMLMEPSEPHDPIENPYLIMAVGNGVMWVAQGEEESIQPGDYLISSNLAGHAMKDPGTYMVSHIVAKAVQKVDWSSVQEVGGMKRAKISVTFEQFDRNATLSDVLAAMSASTTATSTDTTDVQQFASAFMTNLFSRMTMWLADASNGITEIFAKTIRAENVYADTVTANEICVKKSNGTHICVTGDELESALGSNGTAPPSSEPEPNTVQEQPESEQTPEPTPEPEESPAPESEAPPAEEEPVDASETEIPEEESAAPEPAPEASIETPEEPAE